MKEGRTMSESNSITFEFEPASASSEARLTMRLDDGSFRTTHSREAEKRWKEIERIRDEFPGPQIEIGLMERLC